MQELAREIVDNGKHAAAQHDTGSLQPVSHSPTMKGPKLAVGAPTGKITNLCG